ncbi:MAG: helix-turn-helix domain-containing protein [Candidatus Bathyarchaeia archaeon]
MARTVTGSGKHSQVLDFLLAALVQHDRELTALGDSLQESIRLLNKERSIEEYNSQMGRQSSVDTVLKKMDGVVKELWALERSMRRLETDSLELKASTTLSRALAKTFQALSEEGGMTAREVSTLTHRSRAMESLYLNQLSALGLVEKTRRGRRYYFTKKPLRRPVTPVKDSKRVMILVLVSERVSEEPEETQDLVSSRLSNLKDWRLERSAILSR